MNTFSSMELLVQMQKNQLHADIYRTLVERLEAGMEPEQFVELFRKLSTCDLLSLQHG